MLLHGFLPSLLEGAAITLTVALSSLAVAALNIVVLVLLPDALGKAVLGNVWPVLAPLMLPVSANSFMKGS